jgi:dihydrodipicolinate synthase/N-acetylneuraminate lyase
MTKKHFSAVELDRRQFFKWTMTGALAAALPVVGWGRNAPEKWPPRTEKAKAVYRRLHGPQAAITIPFRENFEVDYDALREWTEFMCEADPPILFFTYGDGEIDVLSEEEIAKVNLTVLQQAKGRTLVVGATGPWWTGRMVNFVKRMEDAGLEAINLHFSHRILQEAQLYSAYERIAAETTIPLLIYDSQLPTGAILKLATFPQVAGVKSHAGLYPFYDQVRETRESDFAVLGAGQMKQFLYGAQVGSPGYLCPIAPVAPGVSQRFYRAIRAGEWNEAGEIVFEYEEPLMKATIPLGYPQAYKAMLYLAGLYPTPYVRPPRISPSRESLADLRGFLQSKKIIGQS